MDQKAGWIGVDRAEQHGIIYALICAVPLVLAARFGPWLLLGLPVAIALSITVGVVMHRYAPRHWDLPRFGAVPWNDGLGEPEWRRDTERPRSVASESPSPSSSLPALARRKGRAGSVRPRRRP